MCIYIYISLYRVELYICFVVTFFSSFFFFLKTKNELEL